MSAEEDNSTLLAALERGESALKAAISSLPDDVATQKPEEGCWCALECIEHVILLEGAFSDRIAEAAVLPNPEINKEREISIFTTVSSPAPKITAPAQVHPKGVFGSCTEALDAMTVSNARIVALASEKKDDLRSLQVTHPVLGKLTAYETLLVLAAHRLRHAYQIEQNKKHLTVNTAQ